MSRAVRRNLAGTREQFEAVRDKYPEARMITGADVYWDRSGTLFLVVPEAWADYFHGRRCEMPDDDVLDGGQTFEFDESAFQNLMESTTCICSALAPVMDTYLQQEM